LWGRRSNSVIRLGECQIRRPKVEVRKKAETRRPKPESPSASGFGLRISELGLLSALGLRASGFTTTSPRPSPRSCLAGRGRKPRSVAVGCPDTPARLAPANAPVCPTPTPGCRWTLTSVRPGRSSDSLLISRRYHLRLSQRYRNRSNPWEACPRARVQRRGNMIGKPAKRHTAGALGGYYGPGVSRRLVLIKAPEQAHWRVLVAGRFPTDSTRPQAPRGSPNHTQVR
jgi:hypothetical protein